MRKRRVDQCGVTALACCNATWHYEWVVTRDAPNRARTALLNVRLLDGEKRMLETLAERAGVSASEWIRNTIRAEHVLMVRDRATLKSQKKRPISKR